ncbi:MAG: response regulator [Magnetococcales bacterium]|nr:response regulator [Magnetococcales bacterium]
MRIRSRLNLLVFGSIGSLLLLLALLAWFVGEYQVATDQYELFEDISNGNLEKISLRDQYFLYREARANRQWTEKNIRTRQLVERALGQVMETTSRGHLETIQRELEDDARIMTRIVDNTAEMKRPDANREILREMDKRLMSQSLLHTSRIQDTVAALHQIGDQARQTAYHHLIGAIALFAAILSLVVVVNLLFVGRLIRRRVLALRVGVGIIADGDLGHRLATNETDELADIALSINCMTDKLQALANQLKRDLAELRQKDQILAESESRFRTLFEKAPDAILLADADSGRILDANTEACRLLQRPLAEIVDLHWSQLHASDATRQEGGQAQHPPHPPPWDVSAVTEQVIVRKDGDLVPVEILAHRIVLRGQGVVVGVFRDITERKRVADEMRRAREGADAASHAKSEFIAHMSHEIRTPMNAILGMADLLWESELQPEQRKFVQVFRSAGENLLAIINDVLDLSKIEAGQLSLEQVPFNPAEELNVVRDIMTVRASSRGLRLIHRVEPGVPEWLLGDPTRLRQIFLNLLSNAVKFTERGTVSLVVEPLPPAVLPEETEKVALVFRVEDTGIGIPPDRLGPIFESFVQADVSVTRRFGGTGLGLAIVRKLVEKMAGTIQVASTLGEGTTFTVVIPFAPAQSGSSPTLPDLCGVRALVADDDAHDRLVFQEHLERMHADVEEATSGDVARAKAAEALAAGRPYRLILLDAHISGGEGLPLVDAWRQAGYPTTPIVTFASRYREHYQERCDQAGIRHTLVKPVRRADLVRAIELALQLAPRAPHPLQPDDASGAGGKRPWHILLVDDSEDNRLLIETYLKGVPCVLQTAENGMAALDRMRHASFDLVLMDVQMPIMDGHMATRAWRQIEQERGLPRLPIIALTAHALKEDIALSLEAGCDAHLAKPIRRKILLEMIEHHANRHGSPTVALLRLDP